MNSNEPRDACGGPGSRRFRYSVTGLVFVVLISMPPSAHGQTKTDGSSKEKAVSSAKSYVSIDVPTGRKLLGKEIEVSEVGIQSMLETARKHAPRVANAESRLRKGEARLKGAKIRTPYEPAISLGAERFPIGEFSFGEAKFGIVQRIQIGGERKKRIGAAEAYQKLLQRRLEETRWSVHVEVHRLYNAARVDLRRLKVAWMDRTFSKRLAEIARRRFEAGASSKAGIHLAEGQYAMARERVIDARQRLRSRLEKLAEVSGWDGNALPMPRGKVPEPAVETTDRRLQKLAAESYPPIRRQRAAIELARAQFELEKRRVWPDPAFGLFGKVKDPNNGANVTGLVGSISMPLPIWNRNTAAREAAAARMRVNETELASIRGRLKPEIRRAAGEFRSADRRVEVYRKAVVPAMRKELELLEKGYRAGQFDVTEVAFSERQLLKTRRRTIRALSEYVDTGGDVEKLIGREFWKEPTESSD